MDWIHAIWYSLPDTLPYIPQLYFFSKPLSYMQCVNLSFSTNCKRMRIASLLTEKRPPDGCHLLRGSPGVHGVETSLELLLEGEPEEKVPKGALKVGSRQRVCSPFLKICPFTGTRGWTDNVSDKGYLRMGRQFTGDSRNPKYLLAFEIEWNQSANVTRSEVVLIVKEMDRERTKGPVYLHE